MKNVIGWWSGGVTSAVACKISLDLYGKENIRIIFIDTQNEDDDTYRFKNDCSKWYGLPIESITAISPDFPNIQSVWKKYNSLNIAHGAICSSTLKRDLRKRWEKENDFSFQVFGFDIDETKRAKSMALNYPKANPIFPLLLYGLGKKDCIKKLQKANIEIPKAYKLGFRNNNCLKTGCIQGGIGYWQKMQREFPEKFDAMANMEHELTDVKGKPVTMLKDQSKGGGLVFLKPHPSYPLIKNISIMKGREPKPLMECNGFGCAINDLEKSNNTIHEINQMELF